MIFRGITPICALPVYHHRWLAKRHMPPQLHSFLLRPPARPRSLTQADHGHAYTEEDVDQDHVWNSVIDAVNHAGSEEASEEEDDKEAVAAKADSDIASALSVSPLIG